MSSNNSLLRKADLAIADLQNNGGELSPEQGASFIRKLIKQPTLIRVCRVVEMLAPQRKINKIGFGTRILRAAEYEDAAGILQQGLNHNWTQDQYAQAFRDKPDTGAVYTVRTALSATLQTAQSPEAFTHTMQFLLTNFQQLSKQLRKVKPL